MMDLLIGNGIVSSQEVTLPIVSAAISHLWQNLSEERKTSLLQAWAQRPRGAIPTPTEGRPMSVSQGDWPMCPFCPLQLQPQVQTGKELQRNARTRATGGGWLWNSREHAHSLPGEADCPTLTAPHHRLGFLEGWKAME